MLIPSYQIEMVKHSSVGLDRYTCAGLGVKLGMWLIFHRADVKSTWIYRAAIAYVLQLTTSRRAALPGHCSN